MKAARPLGGADSYLFFCGVPSRVRRFSHVAAARTRRGLPGGVALICQTPRTYRSAKTTRERLDQPVAEPSCITYKLPRIDSVRFS